MLRHLKNLIELTLYAGISCGVAFFTRLNPAFYYPVLLLRLSILAYCVYVIAVAEGNRHLALVLGGAVFIGWFGGYWDLIEVYLHYDYARIFYYIALIIAIPIIATSLYLQWSYGKNRSSR